MTTQKQSWTPGGLDVFVGNADGRGLIRLEIKGTGQHIASMPRGKQSEADAARLALCWNMHDRLIEHLTNMIALEGVVGCDGAVNAALAGELHKSRALLAEIDNAK